MLKTPFVLSSIVTISSSAAYLLLTGGKKKLTDSASPRVRQVEPGNLHASLESEIGESLNAVTAKASTPSN